MPSAPVFRPTATLEERAALRLGQLAFEMLHQMEQVLEPYGLTATQYNALRILNGAGPAGLCGTDVAARLITKAPDVPRLLDRMEEAGLIRRERDPDDRRFVRARITPTGVQCLIDSAPALARSRDERWCALSRAELQALVTLLDKVLEAR